MAIRRDLSSPLAQSVLDGDKPKKKKKKQKKERLGLTQYRLDKYSKKVTENKKKHGSYDDY
tara:strand:- start:55 stop:237 length:183 start_codon:yes stop_codon:yes gene_type:complete